MLRGKGVKDKRKKEEAISALHIPVVELMSIFLAFKQLFPSALEIYVTLQHQLHATHRTTFQPYNRSYLDKSPISQFSVLSKIYNVTIEARLAACVSPKNLVA